MWRGVDTTSEDPQKNRNRLFEEMSCQNITATCPRCGHSREYHTKLCCNKSKMMGRSNDSTSEDYTSIMCWNIV